MAEFTQELRDPNNRTRATDPGPQANIFSGLASAVAPTVGALAKANELRKNRELEKSKDALALARAEDLSGINLGQGLSPEVLEEVDRLETMRQAKEQGNLSQSAYGLRLQSRFLKLLAENPDQASELTTYMGERGFEGLVFRDAKAEVAGELAAQQADREADAAAYKYALQTIPDIDQSLPYEEIVQQGRKMQALMQQRDLLAREAQARAEQARLQIAISQAQKAELQGRFFAVGSEQLRTSLDPLVSPWLQKMEAAGGNLDALNKARADVPFLTTEIRKRTLMLTNEMAQQGASVDTLNDIREGAEHYIKVMELMGDPTINGVQQSTIDSLKLMNQGTFREMFPRFVSLTDNFGGEITNSLVVEHIISNAMKGGEYENIIRNYFFSPQGSASQARANQDIAEFSSNTISTISPEKQAVFAAPYKARTENLAKAVMNGEEVADRYQNHYKAWLDTVDTLVPGQIQPEEFKNAVNTVFNKTHQDGLIYMAEKGVEGAELAIDESRRSAMQALVAGSGAYVSNSWEIKVNPLTGYFSYEYKEPKTGSSFSGRAAIQPLEVRTPDKVKEHVDSMNRLIDFLSETHQYDPIAPKSQKGKALRMAYISGDTSWLSPEGEGEGDPFDQFFKQFRVNKP